MYFTNTPSLNSIEAMMKRPPGSRQRGGGRNRSPYRYRKKDCDCRLCLYYRKRNGCVMKVCPVLDIRLSCKAASFREAVKAAFADVKHIPFQRRLSQIYDRKDDVPMLFQNDRHRQIFETQQISLRKPDNRTLAVLYLLTADHPLWMKTKLHITDSGKIKLENVRLGDIATDGYALWKAAKELQTGEKQISLCELSDREAISDRAFRLIAQAAAISRYGVAVLGFDPNGKPKHAHKRGTGSESSYKGNVSGSQPEYSFHWSGQAEPTHNSRNEGGEISKHNRPRSSGCLFLFEAPIDMLSFISMQKAKDLQKVWARENELKNAGIFERELAAAAYRWRKHSYAASCSVSDRVLFQTLKNNPNIRQVFLCLDSDEPGQTAAKRIADKLFVQGVSSEILIPYHKDWNEDLLAAGKQPVPEEQEEQPNWGIQLS